MEVSRAPLRHAMPQAATGVPARDGRLSGQTIIAACRAIGLDLSMHGLREARAVALAEAGGTVLQIGAWTGHRSLSEIALYTCKWDRQKAVRG